MQRISKFRFINVVLLVTVVGTLGGLCWDGWQEKTSAAKGTLIADIDSFVSERMAVERIPGMAVVVVQDGQITYLNGFGTTSLNNPSPVTGQTVFDLASCSKSFTALAVLLLREDGLVDLDLPVSHYLPGFMTADAQMSQKITVSHLLHQSSGLPGRFAEPLAVHSGEDAMEKLVASLGKLQLNSVPGSSFEYSNLNYCLLGAIIDEVSGVNFEEYMRQRIFLPLGMANTTMIPDEAKEGDRADGHQLLFGHVITRNVPIYRSLVPAGWVMSTAEDMGRWLIIQLDGGVIDGQQIIPTEVIEELHTSGISYEQDDTEIGYGMGWFVGCSDTGIPMVWHGGDTSNFSADMLLLPEYDMGVVVLVNSQSSSESHSFAPGVASIVLGKEVELPTAPWWGSWRGADTLAIVAVVLSTVAFFALVFYSWWRWRRFRLRRTAYLVSIHKRRLKIWRMVLPFTPLVLLMIAVASIYTVVWLLFGFNLFRSLARFGSLSPPGVWIAGWMTFAIICLWSIILATQTIFRYRLRHRFKKLRPYN